MEIFSLGVRSSNSLLRSRLKGFFAATAGAATRPRPARQMAIAVRMRRVMGDTALLRWFEGANGGTAVPSIAAARDPDVCPLYRKKTPDAARASGVRNV